MSLSFGEVFLYSKDPAKLYHFLSFLLDVEADCYEDHKISFKFSSINFIILLDEKIKKNSNRAFSLNVLNIEELKDLARNIEFYYYKEAMTGSKFSLNGEQLSFSDPDGRTWCVEIKKIPHAVTHTVDNKSANVRMC